MPGYITFLTFNTPFTARCCFPPFCIFCLSNWFILHLFFTVENSILGKNNNMTFYIYSTSFICILTLPESLQPRQHCARTHTCTYTQPFRVTSFCCSRSIYFNNKMKYCLICQTTSADRQNPPPRLPDSPQQQSPPRLAILLLVSAVLLDIALWFGAQIQSLSGPLTQSIRNRDMAVSRS